MTANNPSLPRHSGDGLSYHYEDGVLVVHNPGSGQLCNPGGLSGWIEARERNSASAKQTVRAIAKAELRRIEAADKAALGEVFGSLATLLRKNMAAAKRSSGKPAALKRTARRRRRHIKGD